MAQREKEAIPGHPALRTKSPDFQHGPRAGGNTQRLLQIGREAANLMLDMLSSKETGVSRIVTLTTELTEGKSVKALKV